MDWELRVNNPGSPQAAGALIRKPIIVVRVSMEIDIVTHPLPGN
jgi:hypothetical protein